MKIEIEVPIAKDVMVTASSITFALADGRTISVPLMWYPRILWASPEERINWRMIGNGEGIHWNGIDEDISVEDLLAGKGSGESKESLKKWMVSRKLA